MNRPTPTSVRFGAHSMARFIEQTMRTSAQFDPF
ncbi:hypothetical protein PC119_g18002 [Phytophthora cactorum]|uniref:Uncharacterized protein n=1 Tax=Phytophthora cactorum TaxID=29920 RepID=A0A8T1BXK8_9STRA|nr:hypothetical protein PC114_g19071 [Phytophthora cactorum]KAG2910817.1 hypothetical protein PC117_g19304 [Phytophthora cactorum]KAG2995695.1 hypothetical protein PC119_g18002 [Phytophthora cactorum]KAG4040880.1 hypothetical protein PC123_g23584 [Phytophthora cactorum]